MKHCTTDKCPQILDSSCVFYEGASLIFSGINTNDSVETVIQKLNLKLESIPWINLDNYYTKTEVNTLINSIDLSNYFTKTEVNTNLATKLDKSTYAGTAQSLKDEIDNKANSSDVYKKNETYTKTEVDTALATKLSKGTYTGTASDLKSDIDGKADISHAHNISSITNLQTALNDKQDKLSSYDESILIEEGGNIEGNVSLFQEYFQEQNCVLNFTPIQIIGVYVNGIKQRPSSYTITLPKTISVANFTSGDYIEIQYTKLKI